MPDRLRWEHDTENHWNAWMGPDVVCGVTRGNQYVVDSPGRVISGAHTSFESATAQVQAWVRWRSR
ncbi:hypothetical protein [Curtobacterium sp. ISL-83]|uniref:hypothetical protein n=1 Tax=Curtobacterium sp. ISL-83 TaxID=2819145 RepID=UPI001BE89517|nr:hypothetical protein [Curtobacterium sp. ISL-83]MBT2500950.1 hypothetical protein [Curtobacterium sp. ISL-83]